MQRIHPVRQHPQLDPETQLTLFGGQTVELRSVSFYLFMEHFAIQQLEALSDHP